MAIFGDRVDVPPDPSAAAWIAPRLGEFGTVGGLVPGGFERYVLVDHATPEEPQRWDASAELLETLARLAAQHTTASEPVWFAIWEGYGWESSRHLHAAPAGGPLAALARAGGRRRLRKEDQRRAAALRAELSAIPKFDLPGRRYYLLSGPLDAVSRIDRPNHFGLQPPDLWWPDDRRWFVATDTDLTWSYVGGNDALVSDVAVALPTRTKPVQWTAPNSAVLR